MSTPASARHDPGAPSAPQGRLVRRLLPVAALVGWANLTTSAVAASGFFGLLMAAGQPRVALTLLGAAAGLDRLDGFLARRLGEASALGAELDSLADALAFCALPAALGFALDRQGVLGAAAAALFLLCGLWRLAYFNVHGLAGEAAARRYTGLPTTIAASWWLIAAALVLHLPAAVARPLATALTVVLALLMVSRLPYPKDGPATRSLYLLVPAAIAAVWLWRA